MTLGRFASTRRRWAWVAILSVAASVMASAQIITTTLAANVPFVPPVYSIHSAKLRSHLISAAGRLFWTDGSERPLKSIALTGGPIVEHASRMGAPHALVLDGSRVYFLESRDGRSPSGCTGGGVVRAVMSAPTDGSELPRLLALGDRCSPVAPEIVGDGTHVYWAEVKGSPVSTIMAVATAGGAVTPIYSVGSLILALAADSTHLYWAEWPLAPMGVVTIRRQAFGSATPTDVATVGSSIHGGLAVAGGEIFFADEVAGVHTIRKVAVTGGAVTALAPVPAAPLAITVAAGVVYWAEPTAIRAVTTAGGVVTTVVPGIQSPVGLAVSAPDIFWSENTCCPVGGSIMRAPLAGGPAQAIASGVDAPQQLVVRGADVYWAEGQPLVQTPAGAGRIAKAPVSGGAVTTVAGGISSTLFTPLASDGVSVYAGDNYMIKRIPVTGIGQPAPMFRGPGGPLGVVDVATAHGQVYWLDEVGVRRAPAGGGPVTLLTPLIGGLMPRRLALNSTHAYWTDAFAIHAVPLTGGTATTLSGNLASVSDLVADDGFVYFSEQDSGRVSRIPAAGGAAQPLGVASALTQIPLALDQQALYWLDNRGLAGTINRVPKGGGPAVTLASDVVASAVFMSAMATDGTGVSWTEVTSGRVRRAAPPAPPALTLAVNKTTFGTGDALVVTARLDPGDATSQVDAYVVQQDPAGVYRSLQLNGRLVPGVVPLARGITPVPITAEVYRTSISSAAPPGSYAWLSALTAPGTTTLLGPVQQAPYVVTPPLPPGPPSNLTVLVSPVSLVFTWVSSVTGAEPSSYRFEVGSASGLSDLVPAFDTGSATPVFATPPAPSGVYYVRLRAINAGGVSAASNEVRVVVP